MLHADDPGRWRRLPPSLHPCVRRGVTPGYAKSAAPAFAEEREYDCGFAGAGGGYGGYGGGYGGYGGGAMCPLQTGLQQCDLCIGANCMGDCMNCANNPECANLIHCVLGCSDDQCGNACVIKYPGGVDAAIQWLGEGQCTSTKCQTVCGG